MSRFLQELEVKEIRKNRAKGLAVLAVAFLLSAYGVYADEAVSRDPYVGAIVADASTGQILYKENSEALVYPASIVKLMDLLIVVELIEKGVVKADDKVRVTAESALIGGTQVWLEAGEEFTVDEMLYALMIQSANDVAVALAIHIAGTRDGFLKLMNKRASELGMTYTEFNSVHGLPPGANQKHDVTTARDIAILACEAARHPLVLRYTGTKERKFRNDTLVMQNHNRLLGVVEGCDGFKTGYIKLAGFSLAATVKRGNNRVVAVVMGSKFKETRDIKARELIESGFMKLTIPDATSGGSPEYLTTRKTVQSAPAVLPVVVESKKEPKKKPKKKIEEETENTEGPEPLSRRGVLSRILALLLLLGAGGTATFVVVQRKKKEKDKDRYHW